MSDNIFEVVDLFFELIFGFVFCLVMGFVKCIYNFDYVEMMNIFKDI